MRDRLSELGLVSFCKTTGGKGLHVVTPLACPKKRIESELGRSEAIRPGRLQPMAAESPDRYLINMSKAKRTGQDLPRLPSERPVLDGCGASLAPGPAERTGLHARDVGASKARSGSRGIYDPHRASAAEQVEGLGRLLRGERSPLEAIERIGKLVAKSGLTRHSDLYFWEVFCLVRGYSSALTFTEDVRRDGIVCPPGICPRCTFFAPRRSYPVPQPEHRWRDARSKQIPGTCRRVSSERQHPEHEKQRDRHSTRQQ